MTAAVLYGAEDLKIETVDIPKVGDDEVLVRVAVALTCGTDLKVWKRGYHARMIQPRLYSAMNLRAWSKRKAAE